ASTAMSAPRNDPDSITITVSHLPMPMAAMRLVSAAAESGAVGVRLLASVAALVVMAVYSWPTMPVMFGSILAPGQMPIACLVGNKIACAACTVCAACSIWSRGPGPAAAAVVTAAHAIAAIAAAHRFAVIITPPPPEARPGAR